jgi:hypothetical protein
MKTNFLSFGALLIVTCTSEVFAQGTIIFGNHILNSVVAPVYGPDPHAPSLIAPTIGVWQSPWSIWPGPPLAAAEQVTVQLWGGPDASSLAPVPGAVATIAVQGFFPTLSTPVTIAGLPPLSTAQLQVRAWQNQGGTITSWDQAYAAALGGTEEIGQSVVFPSQPLGGGITPPPNLVGLTSFNIHTIPEPSTWALGCLGAALLLLFRRRSS